SRAVAARHARQNPQLHTSSKASDRPLLRSFLRRTNYSRVVPLPSMFLSAESGLSPAAAKIEQVPFMSRGRSRPGEKRASPVDPEPPAHCLTPQKPPEPHFNAADQCQFDRPAFARQLNCSDVYRPAGGMPRRTADVPVFEQFRLDGLRF